MIALLLPGLNRVGAVAPQVNPNASRCSGSMPLFTREIVDFQRDCASLGHALEKPPAGHRGSGRRGIVS